MQDGPETNETTDSIAPDEETVTQDEPGQDEPDEDASIEQADEPSTEEADAPSVKKTRRKPTTRKKTSKTTTRSTKKSSSRSSGTVTASDEDSSADTSETKPVSESDTKSTTKTSPKPAAKTASGPKIKKQLLINYVPGEECRVGILEDGVLEDYHAERPATANRVGNLYLGKVTNVESNLQAAFIDFGGGENAFLHTSDLHPRYFPSEDSETTEKIGKKTPRRERPPIQKCLKRGQKIVVQIMKDGVGTKGPACTSYLSIPGRYLVMMPQMDNVGVSRKVDDEDMRKKMRKILDALDLPEGFGFILRTAGFDKTKTELKRDLSYLQRLWKNIEQRQKKATKPTLLYAESDLLVRALRDMLSKDVDEVIIDHEQGLARATNFLKVVAPRAGTKLLHYNQKAPMFHAYGLEEQVRILHSREVPLPSGGRLVIDETEALVAIDVNSGKSRKANDAETNAYQTNLEAVDEICRQMKLRELGGLVINDLIDMNQARNRKAIEARFNERLKKDRAKTTVLPISEFGILELTRQRMRASATMTHFQELPAAYGRGWIRKADSVAADAMRELRLILSYDTVNKAELVVPARVAGDLLSNRRRALTKLEIETGKHIDVRVSDSLGSDRFTLYAYDETGNDVAIDRLPRPRPPRELPVWEVELDESLLAGDDDASLLESLSEDVEAHPIELLATTDQDEANEPGESAGGKKKRRRRRRRKSGEGDETAQEQRDESEEAQADTDDADQPESATDPEQTGEQTETGEPGTGKKKRRRRRRRRRGGSGDEAHADGEASEGEPSERDEQNAPQPQAQESEEGGTDEGAPSGGKKRRRRRRGGSRSDNGTSTEAKPEGSTQNRTSAETRSEPAAVPEVVTKKKPRLLYASSRRKLKPSEKAALSDD